MKTTLATLALAGLTVFAGAGAAAADTRTIPVQTLHSLSVAGPVRVEVTTGPATSAVLEGSAEDLARVQTRVDRDKLRVTVRCNNGCDDDDLRVTLRVSAPIMQELAASRGASLTATGLNTSILRVTASMGGATEVSGRCNTLEARARMGGALDAEKLICRNVSVNASMGGATTVHATESVDANASMGGTVEIAGSPAHHDATAFMGGIVD